MANQRERALLVDLKGFWGDSRKLTCQFAMVILSRLLAYGLNRWAHFIAVPLMILWVVVPALMLASVDVITMLIILGFVGNWPQPQRRR